MKYQLAAAKLYVSKTTVFEIVFTFRASLKKLSRKSFVGDALNHQELPQCLQHLGRCSTLS
jgi:hypothetical protein